MNTARYPGGHVIMPPGPAGAGVTTGVAVGVGATVGTGVGVSCTIGVAWAVGTLTSAFLALTGWLVVATAAVRCGGLTWLVAAKPMTTAAMPTEAVATKAAILGLVFIHESLPQA